jgi:hypothetical protein
MAGGAVARAAYSEDILDQLEHFSALRAAKRHSVFGPSGQGTGSESLTRSLALTSTSPAPVAHVSEARVPPAGSAAGAGELTLQANHEAEPPLGNELRAIAVAVFDMQRVLSSQLQPAAPVPLSLAFGLGLALPPVGSPQDHDAAAASLTPAPHAFDSPIVKGAASPATQARDCTRSRNPCRL